MNGCTWPCFRGDEKISAGGSVFGAKNLPRIVRLNSQPVEIVPGGRAVPDE